MTNVGYRPVEISWAPQTPSFHLLYSYQPCRADTQRNSPSGKTNEIGIKNTKDLLTINYSLKGIGLFCTKQKFVSKMFDWAQIIWICYLFEEYLCHFLWFILGSHQFRKQMANIKHKEKFMDCWNMIYFLNTLLKLMLTKILFKSNQKRDLPMMELVKWFHISEYVSSFFFVGKLIVSYIEVVFYQVSQVTHIVCLTVQQILNKFPK